MFDVVLVVTARGQMGVSVQVGSANGRPLFEPVWFGEDNDLCVWVLVRLAQATQKGVRASNLAKVDHGRLTVFRLPGS